MIRLLLNNRAANITDRDRWSCLLDESFTMTMPVTPYRSFNHRTEVRGGQRVLCGIDAVIADTASLAIMVEGLGHGNSAWSEAVKRLMALLM